MTQLSLSGRESSLREWLAPMAGCSPQELSIEIAAADASFRRYLRVRWQDHYRIVMDAPPEHEDCKPFLLVTDLLRKGGLHAPECFAQNLEQGFLLLEDLGQITYSQALTPQTAAALYSDAIDALVQLQHIPVKNIVPDYDRERLAAEIDLFPEWYLSRHCEILLTDEERHEWNQFREWLLSTIESYPKVLVHRDYHCRNLMVCEQHNPGILDYQDAVYGPITYDLVSLFKDAYIQWEEANILDWIILYWERARKAQLPVPADISIFHEQFEWMGLQRHLKILGIFARLYHRDGKERYLKDLPVVLDYTRKMAQRFSRCSIITRLLDRAENKNPAVSFTF